MWIVTQTPKYYHPPDGEEFVVLDDQDNEVHNFYKTLEEAVEALEVLLGGK
jgi:hypothetical protein